MSIKLIRTQRSRVNGMYVTTYAVGKFTGRVIVEVTEARPFARPLFVTDSQQEAEDFANDFESLIERDFYVMDEHGNPHLRKAWFFKDKTNLSFGKNEHLVGREIRFEHPRNTSETGWIKFK